MALPVCSAVDMPARQSVLKSLSLGCEHFAAGADVEQCADVVAFPGPARDAFDKDVFVIRPVARRVAEESWVGHSMIADFAHIPHELLQNRRQQNL